VFIDVNGDSVNVSALSSEQIIDYNKIIDEMSKSEKFLTMYQRLVNPNRVYRIIFGIVENSEAGGEFKPTKYGGILVLPDGKPDANLVGIYSHEFYHAFQRDVGGVPRSSYGKDIEALLFEKAVQNDLYHSIFWTAGGNKEFNTAFTNLLLTDFSQTDWITAIKTFNKSSFYNEKLYKDLRPIIYDPPIKEFYPLLNLK